MQELSETKNPKTTIKLLQLGETDYFMTADYLADVIRVQKDISSYAGGTEPTRNNVRTAALAFIDEIMELVKELGWKPWKAKPEIDEAKRQEIIEEWADIMAFFGLLTNLTMDIADVDMFELLEGYRRKSIKNVQRFIGQSGEAGYDGYDKTK